MYPNNESISVRLTSSETGMQDSYYEGMTQKRLRTAHKVFMGVKFNLRKSWKNTSYLTVFAREICWKELRPVGNCPPGDLRIKNVMSYQLTFLTTLRR